MDSEKLRFGLSSSFGPAMSLKKSVVERWTSPLNFKTKFRTEHVFEYSNIQRRFFSLGGLFFTESDSPQQTRSRAFESAHNSWCPLTQKFPEKSPLQKSIHISTADKNIPSKRGPTLVQQGEFELPRNGLNPSNSALLDSVKMDSVSLKWTQLC